MVAISVVLTFLFIIIIDLLVLKLQGKTHPAFEKPFGETTMPFYKSTQSEIPEGVLLSKGHTWAKLLSGSLYQIGIDNFLLKTFNRISINKLPQSGTKVKMGDILIEGSAGNKILKLLSPLSGTILSLNNNPEVNDTFTPYSQWQILIQVENKGVEDSFLSGKKAALWIKNEFIRLNEFIAVHSGNKELAGVTMYDGGAPVENTVDIIIEKSFKEFEKEFLKL